MFLISDLVNQLDSYLDKESVAKVYQAYLFGATAHDGQTRKTGEPYIYHPIAVASILANMGCDGDTIVAAILHDVIEDTSVAKEQISQKFGVDVAHMVDGVSKLIAAQNQSHQQAQANNFRKMMLAMSSDIRVILIKIADRLHNMRTLYGMPADKRQRIAEETLSVYVPVSERLGMYEIKQELEQLVLQNMYPWRYRILDKAIKTVRGKAHDKNHKIEAAIKNSLLEIGIEATLMYREKSLFSIYDKMRTRPVRFKDLTDIFALRIIVPTVQNCYQALGIVHNLHKPILGKFKDYIAIPKTNGYQSLHTVLFAQNSYNIEVQIRTKMMDEVAESGIASHWQYKSRDDFDPNDISQLWLQQVAELQDTASDSEEFLESVKFDLFSDRVFVFSPNGKIFELPRGATALDFAYAVHTEIGEHCKTALIDGLKSHLGTPLKNGQTVEIQTEEVITTTANWLDMATTGKALSNIKNRLRKFVRADAILLGEKILDTHLSKHDLSLKKIKVWAKLLTLLQLDSKENLFEAIGSGKRDIRLVLAKLLDIIFENKKQQKIRRLSNLLRPLKFKKTPSVGISGAEGFSVHYAECCMPLPGDKIIGQIKPEIGLIVHECRCKKFKNKQIATTLHWHPDQNALFATEILVILDDKPGALAAVTAEISKHNTNIIAINVKSAKAILRLSVKSRHHLANIVRSTRKLPVVQKIKRIYNQEKL